MTDLDCPVLMPADDVEQDRANGVDGEETSAATPRRRRVHWLRLLGFGLLPAVALLLTVAVAYLKWVDSSVRDAQLAGVEAVRAASGGTVALLSYKPDTVEKDLTAATGLLTGQFRDAYSSLTRDVVIPGSTQQGISATAAVPAAAVVSATPSKAVVLVFVNQTTTIGTSPPTDTASTVRVALDNVDGRWLIAQFDPI